MSESGGNFRLTNLETETQKINRVAMKDLNFWFPHTKEHICKGVPFARTFGELVMLPIAQVGYILAIIIRIIRKNRKVGGQRMTNATLKVKVDA